MAIDKLRALVLRPLGAFLAIGLAAFCVCSLASASSWFAPVKPVAELQLRDDPLRQGFAILDMPRKVSTPPRVENNEQAAVLLLDDWTYTGKSASQSK